jgi:hypothetical protein
VGGVGYALRPICPLSIRVNGHTSDPFSPSRGLEQGDPLSPYMFLFVGESLPCLLKKHTSENRVTPLKVSRGALGISNLLFAYDSLLFFKANREEVRVVDITLKFFLEMHGSTVKP